MASLPEAKSDLWIGGGLLGLCGFFAWRTSFINAGVGSSNAGPSFMPWLMIALIAALSIGLILRALLRDPAANLQISIPGKRTLAAMATFTVVMVAYATAFMPIGYLPSTLVTFVIGLLLMGERNWVIVILFPIATTAVVYLGFTQLLSVWLP